MIEKFAAFTHTILPIILGASLIAGCFPGGYRSSIHTGVRTGDGLFNITTFFQGNVGGVTDICIGNFDGAMGTDIAIAGDSGAAFCDTDGTVKSTVLYYIGAQEVVDLVDIGNDGLAEYLVRGSWSHQSCVLNHDGTMLWEADGPDATDDMDFGDVDGDGDIEFVAGYNGGGGVRLFDETGRRLWRMDGGNVWHVEIADTNGDGKDEIIHTNAGGTVEIRDENGMSNRSGITNMSYTYVSHFTISRWPGRADPYYVFAPSSGNFEIYDLSQKSVRSLDAPEVTDYGNTKITPVTLKAGEDEYLAVMKSEPFADASILLIYDHSGTLLYEEVLHSIGIGLLAFDPDGDGVESLLVGSDGVVLNYEYTG